MNFAIIAAGEGSRLVSEGVARPKPLVDIDGRPMVRRLLDIFGQCGAEVVAVIVNEQMTEVADYLRQVASELPFELRLVVQSTPSSMHSFHALASQLPEGKFVMTTVDTIFHPEAFSRYVAEFAADTSADGYMGVTTFIDDEKPLYLDVDNQDFITAYRDEASAHDRFISAGIYGLSNPGAAVVLNRCIAAGMARMRRFQRELVAEGWRLKAYDLGKVIDVDHAADIAVAKQLIQSK